MLGLWGLGSPTLLTSKFSSWSSAIVGSAERPGNFLQTGHSDGFGHVWEPRTYGDGERQLGSGAHGLLPVGWGHVGFLRSCPQDAAGFPGSSMICPLAWLLSETLRVLLAALHWKGASPWKHHCVILSLFPMTAQRLISSVELLPMLPPNLEENPSSSGAWERIGREYIYSLVHGWGLDL